MKWVHVCRGLSVPVIVSFNFIFEFFGYLFGA